MNRILMVVVLAVAVAAVVGCGEAEKQKRPEEVAAEKVQQAMQAGELDAEDAGDVVEVAAAGTAFDPPVQISQIPAGAWYCDMGTVHYARLTRGDGVCKECGMSLTRQGG
jgi:hypothetical protein